MMATFWNEAERTVLSILPEMRGGWGPLLSLPLIAYDLVLVPYWKSGSGLCLPPWQKWTKQRKARAFWSSLHCVSAPFCAVSWQFRLVEALANNSLGLDCRAVGPTVECDANPRIDQ